MRIRHIITSQKVIQTDTAWRTDAMPPRLSGIYPKSLPARAHWKWRSALAEDAKCEYILLCQVNESKANWLAWLIRKTAAGGSLISRYEYHGSHPGLHVHADCTRGGIDVGPSGLDKLLRIPSSNFRMSRPAPTRLDLFWKNACSHYRMDYKKGDLL